MKLNQDCVREILLELETKLLLNNHVYLEELKTFDTFRKFGEDTTIYAVLKLIEAGLLNGNHQYGSNELVQLGIASITWDGHLFLDTVRDNAIWSQTKETTKKLSSVSLSLISDIATHLLKEQFGLN